jgi:hypothetical protein
MAPINPANAVPTKNSRTDSESPENMGTSYQCPYLFAKYTNATFRTFETILRENRAGRSAFLLLFHRTPPPGLQRERSPLPQRVAIVIDLGGRAAVVH